MPDFDAKERAEIQEALKLFINELRSFFDKGADGAVISFNLAAEINVRKMINAHNFKYKDSPDDQRLSVGIVQAWYRKLIEEYDKGNLNDLQIDSGVFFERSEVVRSVTDHQNDLIHSRSGSLLCQRDEDGNIIFPALIDIKSKSALNENLCGKLFFPSGDATTCKFAFDVSDINNITKYASLSFKAKDVEKKRIAADKMSKAIVLNNSLAEKSIHFDKIFNIMDQRGKPHRYIKFSELGEFTTLLKDDVLNHDYAGSLDLNRGMIEFYGTEVEACKIDMLLQYAQSLAELEAAQISHNDLKPENTFCTYNPATQRIILKNGDPEMMTIAVESKPTTSGTMEYLPKEVWIEFTKRVLNTKDKDGNFLTMNFALYNLIKKLYDRYTKNSRLQKDLTTILKDALSNQTSEQIHEISEKIFSQYPQYNVADYTFTSSELDALEAYNPNILEGIDDLMMQARDPIYGLELFLQELGLDPVTALQIGKVYDNKATLDANPDLLAAYNRALQQLSSKPENWKDSPTYQDSYCGKKDQWAVGIICMQVTAGRFPDLLTDATILNSPPFDRLLSQDPAQRMTGSQFKDFVIQGLQQTPDGRALLDKINKAAEPQPKLINKTTRPF